MFLRAVIFDWPAPGARSQASAAVPRIVRRTVLSCVSSRPRRGRPHRPRTTGTAGHGKRRGARGIAASPRSCEMPVTKPVSAAGRIPSPKTGSTGRRPGNGGSGARTCAVCRHRRARTRLVAGGTAGAARVAATCCFSLSDDRVRQIPSGGAVQAKVGRQVRRVPAAPRGRTGTGRPRGRPKQEQRQQEPGGRGGEAGAGKGRPGRAAHATSPGLPAAGVVARRAIS